MNLGLRWTIGDVSAYGFEALRLSIWGAYRCFGAAASYAVCVNTVSVERVRALVGDLPTEVRFIDATAMLPERLRAHLDAGMAEGVAWKLAPVRLFSEAYELALDNDCILWARPPEIDAWLGSDGVLLAEDVRACFGQFAPYCPTEPRNLGLRGLPPGFDLETALQQMLERTGVQLTSELDEQGLQVATLAQLPAFVVPLREISICSPFPPHLRELGRCGAHFVGLNAKSLPWEYEGRPASELTYQHFERLRPELYSRVGAPYLAVPRHHRPEQTERTPRRFA